MLLRLCTLLRSLLVETFLVPVIPACFLLIGASKSCPLH
jgi:hypothetical protein